MHYSDIYISIISVRIESGGCMKEVVGRSDEKKELGEVFSSKRAEFVLVYGRRRIGKTFLVKKFFQKKSCLFFHVTGIQNGLLSEQLDIFTKTIGDSFYHGATIATPASWMSAFEELNRAINTQGKSKKIVLFMDEFPWMATKRSRLLQAVEYYWNRYWQENKNIKLVICGSSAAWLVKKILYQKGGLHNRITKQLILRPFNLLETKQFLESKHIYLDPMKVTQLYLALGGIPFYLDQVQKNKSIATNINRLCFKETGILFHELSKMFQSLFEYHEDYLGLTKFIAEQRYGVARSSIEASLSKHGGRLTQRLSDLEMAGFVKSFLPLFHEKHGLYYRVIDEFSYFYLKWIAPEKSTLLSLDSSHQYWNQKTKGPSYRAWSGYAFEMLCYKHIPQIKRKLGITDDSKVGAWRYAPRKNDKGSGAQVDLVFNQHDSIVLCEIKFTEKTFSIDKEYAEKLLNKMRVFKQVTKTKKEIFIVIISASGLNENKYSSELISGVVMLEDLFT